MIGATSLQCGQEGSSCAKGPCLPPTGSQKALGPQLPGRWARSAHGDHHLTDGWGRGLGVLALQERERPKQPRSELRWG